MITPRTASQRYLWRFAPAMIVYVVLLFAVTAWLKAPHAPAGPLLYAGAAAPALPLVVVIWSMGRYLVEETDEYQRARRIQSILWGTGATLAIATVWGFLESFAGFPHLPAYYVFIVFCAALGVAQGVSKLFELLGERR